MKQNALWRSNLSIQSISSFVSCKILASATRPGSPIARAPHTHTPELDQAVVATCGSLNRLIEHSRRRRQSWKGQTSGLIACAGRVEASLQNYGI